MNGVPSPQSSSEAISMANVLKPALEAIIFGSSLVTITQIGTLALNKRRGRHLQQLNGSNVNIGFTTVLSSVCAESA